MGLGRIIKGNVNDCNPKTLERALQNYDKQLYLKWNPEKNYGYGIWEIRRRPDSKSHVYKGVYLDGSPLYQLEYRELDLVNHVIDLNTLTIRVLDRLYEMDTTRTKHWVDNLEYNEERSQVELENKAREDLRYAIRQEKKAFETMYEAARSGKNAAAFFAGTYKSNT